jgi:hypothetical protein
VLGLLILIFLGWQFLAAEIIGGLVLIVIRWLDSQLMNPGRNKFQPCRKKRLTKGDIAWAIKPILRTAG